MIIVSVLLLSAIDGRSEELARMEICNMGTGTVHKGNYSAETLRGRSTADFARRTRQRIAYVNDHPRQREHVWNLVAKALRNLRYGGDWEQQEKGDVKTAESQMTRAITAELANTSKDATIAQLLEVLDKATSWIENEETSTQGPSELAIRDKLLKQCHVMLLEAAPS